MKQILSLLRRGKIYFIELLIVIIGVTAAFWLNTMAESNKADKKKQLVLKQIQHELEANRYYVKRTCAINSKILLSPEDSLSNNNTQYNKLILLNGAYELAKVTGVLSEMDVEFAVKLTRNYNLQDEILKLEEKAISFVDQIDDSKGARHSFIFWVEALQAMEFNFVSLLDGLLYEIKGVRDDLDKGLELYCPFDMDSTDKSLNGYHAHLKGATYSNESKVGNGSVYFDGEDDYIEFPENEIYFEGSYSINVWVKWIGPATWARVLDFNGSKPKTGNAVTWLCGRADSTKSPLWLDEWVYHENKFVESIVDFARTDPADASLHYSIPNNEWAHLVVVYDENEANHIGEQVNTNGDRVPLQGKVSLYVNGKKHSESYYCLRPQPFPTINNWLGRSAYASDPYFKGYMDDFRLYNRVLSDEEVQKLYSLK